LNNIGGVYPVLLIISLWSWEISCAHFNLGVTLGSLLFHIDEHWCKKKEYKKNLMQFFLIILCEFIGSLFGVFLTFAASKIVWPDGLGTKTKEIYPNPPTLCPRFTASVSASCDTDKI